MKRADDTRADRHARWTERLREVAATPLAYRADFPETADRWERWWAFDADRPLLSGAVPKRKGGSALAAGKALHLLREPEAWLEAREAQLDELYWIDSSVPDIRADLGPVCIGAMLGAPLHLAPSNQTTWQSPVLGDDWDGAVPELDETNEWLRIVLTLAERAADAGTGRYLVSLPDLSAAPDILANLRGTEPLLMDLYDRPEAVVAACAELTDRWERVFDLLYETITSRGAGITTWVAAWSNQPYTLPTCDFNYMIGAEQFRRFCLPSLTDQARRTGRCVIHIDGPGAIKHMEAVAATPEITAVQFTPGAGTPSALAWLDTWHMLQDAKKPITLACPASEVADLCAKLDPRGLAMLVQGVATPADAIELEAIAGVR